MQTEFGHTLRNVGQDWAALIATDIGWSSLHRMSLDALNILSVATFEKQLTLKLQSAMLDNFD